MPRGKVPKAVSSSQDTSTKNNNITVKENSKNDGTKDSKVPNLSMFKFEKKPHVKIEFEEDSPEKSKEEPKGLWEPANWKEFLVNLRNMRSNNDAPVDSMGCHKTMDPDALPKVMRYQSLIALMLSSQTKDQVTFAAMERLKERGLTIDNILEMSDDELGKLIYPVGFWKTKVKYIKKTTQTLKEQYDGDIPDSVEKLCKLTGVGPKMAHICMQVAWNKTTGIGVDTHVHRISNRIGWVRKPTATPEDTRKALQSWLPFDLWSEVNHLMVGFGQTICLPISPLCHECLNRDICPSSGMGRKSPIKKSPIKQAIKDEIKEEMQKSDDAVNTLLVPSLKLTNNLIDVLPAQEQVLSTLKVEEKPANSRKRKVSPKKSSEVSNEATEDEHDMGVHLAVKSPNKRDIFPKKDNIEEIKKQIDNKTSNMGNDSKPIKKSPRKRKVPSNNDNLEDIVTTTEDGAMKKSPNKRRADEENTEEQSKLHRDDDGVKSVKSTKSTKRISKTVNPINVITEASQGTRKSSRNKNIPANDKVENNT